MMSIAIFNCQLVHEKLHCKFFSLLIHQIYGLVSGSLAVHAQENCIPNGSFLCFRVGELASFYNFHNMGVKFSRCIEPCLARCNSSTASNGFDLGASKDSNSVK